MSVVYEASLCVQEQVEVISLMRLNMNAKLASGWDRSEEEDASWGDAIFFTLYQVVEDT